MNEYEKQANDWAEKWGVTMTARKLGHFAFHEEDADTRDVYEIALTRDSRRMTFKFGQSLVDSRYDQTFSAGPYWRKLERLNEGTFALFFKHRGKKPTMYDVIAGIQRQDPGTFEQFCGDFGYDTDSRKALQTYFAVQQEAADFRRLCRDDVVIAEAEEIQ